MEFRWEACREPGQLQILFGLLAGLGTTAQATVFMANNCETIFI